MAHFAQLDENNNVINVIQVNDASILDENGQESEDIGIEYCKNIMGENTIWKQTSINKNIRYNYASVGFTYDSSADAFIPPKPYNSWVLNTSTYEWDPPIPLPNDGSYYEWNEEIVNWELVNLPSE